MILVQSSIMKICVKSSIEYLETPAADLIHLDITRVPSTVPLATQPAPKWTGPCSRRPSWRISARSRIWTPPRTWRDTLALFRIVFLGSTSQLFNGPGLEKGTCKTCPPGK